MAVIPKEKYSDIQRKFNQVISFSQNIAENRIVSDKTFATWAANKSRFYDYFEGQLIKEFGPVTTCLSTEQKEKEYLTFREWLIREYSYPILEESIDKLINFLNNYISANNFYDNIVPEDIVIKNADNETKKISQGSKLIRAFRHFFSSEEEKKLRKIQDKASEYIQTNEISGILCLSIHPLDFLSLSENASNWRSCHALDGGYRAGNLSYMMDTSTIIAYIKSPEDKQISRFPFLWNDKKWRNLIFFDDTMSVVFAGRPYPMASMEALQMVRDRINQIFKTTDERFHNWEYNEVTKVIYNCYKNLDDISEETKSERIENSSSRYFYDTSTETIISIKNLVWNKEREEGFCHYNDLTFSSCYFPYHMRARCGYYYSQMLHIGHEVYSLVDSEDDIITQDYSDTFTGYPPEEDEYVCELCEAKKYNREDIIWVDGKCLCLECAREATMPCQECNRIEFKKFMYISKENPNICKCLTCLASMENIIEEGELDKWQLIV